MLATMAMPLAEAQYAPSQPNAAVGPVFFVRVAAQSTNPTELPVKLQPAPYPQPGGTAARRFFYSLLVQLRLPIHA